MKFITKNYEIKIEKSRSAKNRALILALHNMTIRIRILIRNLKKFPALVSLVNFIIL